MHRRIVAVLVGCLCALAVAGPAFADTVPGPGPGNFRDSGSSLYLGASSSECGQSTCTDTNVYGSITTLRGGETSAVVCVDQFTYPQHGGGSSSSLSGCADVAPDIASDLSSGSVDATILAEQCGRQRCSNQEVELSVSAELTAVSGLNAYSYTQKQQYQNCTDSYRVRGEASDAEGSIVVDGTTFDAFGQLGHETFAFSSRCR
ncbi:MAG: hypothetical protein ACJ77D_00010 [Chloroflexota bacterium]